MLPSFADNPIVRQQERMRYRSILLSPILPILIFLMTMLLGAIGLTAGDATRAARTGSVTWHVMMFLAFLLLTGIGFFRGTQRISQEHNARTWEPLLLTGITPRRLVSGMYWALLLENLNVLLLLLPLGGAVFVLGGASWLDLLCAMLLLLSACATAVAAGMAFGAVLAPLGRAGQLLRVLVLLFALFQLLGMLPMLFFGLISESGIAPLRLWSTQLQQQPFGIEYVCHSLLLPLYLLCVPAWLLFEVAVASTNEYGSDRLWGVKRAAFVALAAQLLFGLPVLLLPSSERRLSISVAIHVLLMLPLLSLSSLLLADDLYPLRRARLELQTAPKWRSRLLPPVVTRSVASYLSAWCVAALLLAWSAQWSIHRLGFSPWCEHIGWATLSFFPYLLFYQSFELWLRCGGRSPWAARLLNWLAQICVHVVLGIIAILLLALAAAAALDAHASQTDSFATALLGPTLAVPIILLIDNSSKDTFVIGRGGFELGLAISAALYLLLSLLLWTRAMQRTSKAQKAELDAEMQFEAVLRAEQQQQQQQQQAPTPS